ncbi:MAG TPA: hypothetical protein VIU11_21200 [Nakamurella sp.]
MSAPINECRGCWVDWTDPLVHSTIVTGRPDPDYDVSDPDESVALAVQVASDILLRLTAYLVHPAGTAEEDYLASPRIRRLSTNWRPLRQVLEVARIGLDGLAEPLGHLPVVIGHDAYFSASRCSLNYWVSTICRCDPNDVEYVRMRYRFGSTVTASARRAVLYLSRQLWLQANPSQGECELPERVTSVNREGLSYTIFDPQTYLMERKTGLPSVDLWLAAINPAKAVRPAGIWTPDAPPPVNHTTRWTSFEELSA